MAAKKMELVKAEPKAPEGATVLAMLDKMSTMPDVDPARIAQMYEIHQKMQADAAKREFLDAMSLCEEAMEPIKKDAANPQTRSKYATHTALDAAMRPTYTNHGFALSFDTSDSPLEQHVRVVLYLSHRGGHERRYQIDMPCDGKGPKGNDVMSKTHAVGSAFSYGKRYLQGGAFNIVFAGEDDDGNKASKTVKPTDTPNAYEPITQPQEIELTAIGKQVGANEARFCNYAGKQWGRPIEKYSDLMQGEFEAAKAKLLSKKKTP